ncbi:MAG: hypothetical protein LKE44_05095 [Eubacterium sp.]|jgi:hypothetical protein|nr:hypothetical protein [Eubacterium sp.]
MKRENAWRKGASRLLLLILAAAVIVSFSFTSVLAMDAIGNDNQNGGSSSNQSGSYPVYIYAKLKTSDGMVVWSAKTSDGQIQESKNKDGWITLGKLIASNSGWDHRAGSVLHDDRRWSDRRIHRRLQFPL